MFDEIIDVDSLDSGDAEHLALLRRPELGITFTKLHCWRLVQYQKCVFLDADTLVIKRVKESCIESCRFLKNTHSASPGPSKLRRAL